MKCFYVSSFLFSNHQVFNRMPSGLFIHSVMFNPVDVYFKACIWISLIGHPCRRGSLHYSVLFLFCSWRVVSAVGHLKFTYHRCKHLLLKVLVKCLGKRNATFWHYTNFIPTPIISLSSYRLRRPKRLPESSSLTVPLQPKTVFSTQSPTSSTWLNTSRLTVISVTWVN